MFLQKSAIVHGPIKRLNQVFLHQKHGNSVVWQPDKWLVAVCKPVDIGMDSLMKFINHLLKIHITSRVFLYKSYTQVNAIMITQSNVGTRMYINFWKIAACKHLTYMCTNGLENIY